MFMIDESNDDTLRIDSFLFNSCNVKKLKSVEDASI